MNEIQNELKTLKCLILKEEDFIGRASTAILYNY